MKLRVIPSIVVLLLVGASALAQRPPDIPLNPAINRQVVEGAIRAVNKYYVSADVAKRVEDNLRQRLQKGEYDKITSAYDLMDALDAHMQGVSRDRHLALAYSYRPEPLLVGTAARARNFGFEKVERLLQLEFLRRLRAKPAIPASPVPRRRRLTGSGTAFNAGSLSTRLSKRTPGRPDVFRG